MRKATGLFLGVRLFTIHGIFGVDNDDDGDDDIGVNREEIISFLRYAIDGLNSVTPTSTSNEKNVNTKTSSGTMIINDGDGGDGGDDDDT